MCADLFGDPDHEQIDPTYSAEFEKWWSYWILLGRAVKKKKAYELWRSKKRALRREMLITMKQQLKYWMIVDRIFRPHPTTYLNNGRWEDSPEDILGRPLKKWEK